ncbi:lactonase [Pseudoclavibacter sp. JAI123]|uniref:SMP-30/gluconolactonase/LRE family protein n=1 Tax=Pseudoclavibacter sp. JAI123 TaxID=2723065 RepID=UPI0015CD4EAC|nr:SMP-30/gluconolactonase/LRE family protein [Pseudoclavibacter sp. JAI123]NYF12247.1 lactonase [Pseudoclavibacter sp. JAI123]
MTSPRNRKQPAAIGAGAALLTLALSGCSTTAGQPASDTSAPQPTIVATEVAQVTTVHEATGMTLLEGPTFSDDGLLYLVDVTAPPGSPKVHRINVDTGESSSIYTDDQSALTSAQFNPADGRLYVTDFLGGRILSMTAEGEDPRVVFEGEIEGAQMSPDDLSFDDAGAMFVTDAAGALAPYWEPTGRLVRVSPDGATADVLASELASPNGLAFTPDSSGLWVTLNTGNQVDYLTLADDGTSVATAHPAIRVDAGKAQIDSAAVDADGNLYVGLHNRAAILVYDPDGSLVAEVVVPDDAGVSSATNIAIQPGTTNGFLTASGEEGGFVYAFEALGEGIRPSNGG